jgi:hypothetical protein
MSDHPGTTLVRFSDELLATLVTRDADCNQLILEVGEPDSEGVCTATVTVNRLGNPLAAAEAAIRSLLGQRWILANRLATMRNGQASNAATRAEIKSAKIHQHSVGGGRTS